MSLRALCPNAIKCHLFWRPTACAKRGHQKDFCAEKSSMIEGILCQTRKSPRSILGVCEERFIAEWCKIHQSEPFKKQKIVNDEIIFVRSKGAKAEHTWRMWAFRYPPIRAKRTHQNDFSKKNEVFGGNSTHGRAPPAVLATICRNLPISSTNLKLLT